MTLKLETGIRTDGLSLAEKTLMDARDGFEGRREAMLAHLVWLQAETAKTQATIDRCEAAIKELTTAIYGVA